MIRKSIIAAAFGLVTFGALSANAASVTVNVGNLDAKAAHAKIVEAAAQACREEFNAASPLEAHYGLSACIADTTEAAEAQLAARHKTLAKL